MGQSRPTGGPRHATSRNPTGMSTTPSATPRIEPTSLNPPERLSRTPDSFSTRSAQPMSSGTSSLTRITTPLGGSSTEASTPPPSRARPASAPVPPSGTRTRWQSASPTRPTFSGPSHQAESKSKPEPYTKDAPTSCGEPISPMSPDVWSPTAKFAFRTSMSCHPSQLEVDERPRLSRPKWPPTFGSSTRRCRALQSSRD